MANTYTTLGGLFTAIANAIRAKKGTTDTIVADNFPSEIESIASQPSLQSKTVSPSTAAQTITPDSGYDGLSQVVVNAISPTKGAQTYTPTTTNQTISSGRWLTGTQTIKGDANLVASNIKSGVSIFGVSGELPVPNIVQITFVNNTEYKARVYHISSTGNYRMSIIQTGETTTISLVDGFFCARMFESYSAVWDCTLDWTDNSTADSGTLNGYDRSTSRNYYRLWYETSAVDGSIYTFNIA